MPINQVGTYFISVNSFNVTHKHPTIPSTNPMEPNNGTEMTLKPQTCLKRRNFLRIVGKMFESCV